MYWAGPALSSRSGREAVLTRPGTPKQGIFGTSRRAGPRLVARGSSPRLDAQALGPEPALPRNAASTWPHARVRPGGAPHELHSNRGAVCGALLAAGAGRWMPTEPYSPAPHPLGRARRRLAECCSTATSRSRLTRAGSSGPATVRDQRRRATSTGGAADGPQRQSLQKREWIATKVADAVAAGGGRHRTATIAVPCASLLFAHSPCMLSYCVTPPAIRAGRASVWC